MNRNCLGLVLGTNQTLSWGMTFYLPAVIVVPAARDLNQSTFVLLGAFSVSLLISGACAPNVGRWIDLHGGKGSIAASIMVLASGQGIIALSPNLAVWYIGWSVLGIGMAMGLYDAASRRSERYWDGRLGRPSPASLCWPASRARYSGRLARRSLASPAGAVCCCCISASCFA